MGVLAHERRKGEDVGAELPLLGTGGRGLRDKARGVSREEGSGITSTSRNTSTSASTSTSTSASRFKCSRRCEGKGARTRSRKDGGARCRVVLYSGWSEETIAARVLAHAEPHEPPLPMVTITASCAGENCTH